MRHLINAIDLLYLLRQYNHASQLPGKRAKAKAKVLLEQLRYKSYTNCYDTISSAATCTYAQAAESVAELVKVLLDNYTYSRGGKLVVDATAAKTLEAYTAVRVYCRTQC